MIYTGMIYTGMIDTVMTDIAVAAGFADFHPFLE